ncbi:MAG: UDP-3-O-acyl-N-acetylglucosamine deacetylase [Rhizobiaceae bacterium]
MGIELNGYQTTVKDRVTLSGVGVHNGTPVSVTFLPADADTGIVFQKSLRNSDGREVRAVVAEVGSTDFCTVLGNCEASRIGTVEHLMATFAALGVDNVTVLIDGDEVPILDGSAQEFVDAIDQVGLEIQPVKRRFIRITKPVRVDLGASWAEFHPYAGTRFEVEIDFANPAIGRQAYVGELSAETFRRDLARARTFGFMKDVERLWAAGLALGSSLDNSIVIGDDERVINHGGLRYKDEFVRHKVMDAVGDLALAGARFIGCYRSYRGGHKLNAMALRALLLDQSAYEVVEPAAKAARSMKPEFVAVNAPAFAPWML